MQNFEPQSIPRIHESASQMFNFRQNIVFFLAACELIGVPKSKLFRVNDLWDKTSMVAVVDCLVSLAHQTHIKWPEKAPGFVMPPEEKNEELLENCEANERLELLKQIKMTSVGSVSMVKKRQTLGYRMSLRDASGEIKSLIGSAVDADRQVLTRGISRFQALFRGFSERQMFQNRLRDSAYRERVTYEILSTEQAYVDSLETCIEVYLRPLEIAATLAKPILSDDKIQIMFKGLETILAANRTLLAKLKMRLGSWHPNVCVGDVFGLIDDFLNDYTEYIQNYSESHILLKREAKKKAFKEFLSKQKLDPRTRGRELDQFLIMPVQRIPRYNLLLRELLKHTWESHPDYVALDAGVERLVAIATLLNEKKREAEALQRTFHVQEILNKAEVNVHVGTRRYAFEGELYDTHGKPIVVYLFSDLMIICTDKNDRAHTEADERRANRKKVKFSEILELSADMGVVDVVAPSSSNRLVFIVTIVSTKKAIELHAPTIAAKKAWLDALRITHAKLATLTMLHQPLLIPGSPSLEEGGPKSSRGSTSNSRRTGAHRRNKSSVESFDMLKLRDSGTTTSLQDINNADVVEKKRFFPLPSPRAPRPKLESSPSVSLIEEEDGGAVGEDGFPPPLPEKKGPMKSSGGSVRKMVAKGIRMTQINKLWDKNDREEKSERGEEKQHVAEDSADPEPASTPLRQTSKRKEDDMIKLSRLMKKKESSRPESVVESECSAEDKFNRFDSTISAGEELE